MNEANAIIAFSEMTQSAALTSFSFNIIYHIADGFDRSRK